MKNKLLKEAVFDALENLINFDGDVIQIFAKEECINHRFAVYLEKSLLCRGILNGYCVDIEYDKYKNAKKRTSTGLPIRPDVLVHKRTSGNKGNLIVIEAKKGYSSKHDNKKVEDLVGDRKFNYSIGVLVSYLPSKSYLKMKFLFRDIENKVCSEKYWIGKKTFDIKKSLRELNG